MPFNWLSHPNSVAIGRIAMLMFTRSMLHNMKATKHSPTITHRRFSHSCDPDVTLSMAYACTSHDTPHTAPAHLRRFPCRDLHVFFAQRRRKALFARR